MKVAGRKLKGMTDLKLETLYEDDVLQIHLGKEFSLIQLTFRKQPDPERFRNGYRLAIDAALRKEVQYWLTDARQIKVMQPENQSWLVENMMPLLKSFKIQKFAIVMAPECFVMTSPNQVYNRPSAENEAPPAGSIKVHFDIGAATSWLFNAN